MTATPAHSEASHRRPIRLRFALPLLGLGLPALSGAATDGPSAVAYPMAQTSWTMTPPVGWTGKTAASATFARSEGIPTGTMTLNEGVAALAAGGFAEGQIDLDIKPLGYSDAGVIFHRRGEDEGEFVYVRANPDCPAAQDCVQYAPITHRLMGWNIYPNYQGPAAIATSGWNHLTVQVAGGRMRVYVNHAAEPAIVVPRLLGLTQDGGIALKGPAIYANLVVRPRPLPDLSAVRPIATVPGTITDWQAAPPTAFDRSRALSAAMIPSSGAWRAIEVEPTGLVNLGRAFGPAHAPAISTGWLKTTIDAPIARTTRLHVGFAMQLSVFLNGRLIYHGNNPYYPEADRLAPDGRIGIDNATVALDLRRGRNDLVLAVNNDWRADLPTPRPSNYGWAAEARIDPPEAAIAAGK